MAKDKLGINGGQFYTEVGRGESGSQPRFYLGRVGEVTEDAARLRRARLREFWTRYLKHNRLNGYPIMDAEPFEFWIPGVIDYAKKIAKGATRLVYDQPGTDQMVLDAVAELNQHYDGVVQWAVPDHRRARTSLIATELHAAARLASQASAVEAPSGLHADETVHGWLTKYAAYAKTTKLVFDADVNANQTSEWGHNFARQARFLSRGFPDLPLAALDYGAIEKVVLHFANRPVSKRSGKPIAVKYAGSLIKVWKAFIKWLPKQTAWRKPDEWEDAFGHRPKKNNVEKSARAIGTVAAYTVQQLPIIYRYATPYERVLFLLALNCGFGAKEISLLTHGQCHISPTAESFVKRVRTKSEVGVYGEHWLFPQTVEAILWSQNRSAVILKRPLGPNDPIVLRKNGDRLVKLTKIGNRSNKAANAWQNLTARIQKDHPEFPSLSFGKMRKTSGNLIKSFSDGETVAVFHQRSSAVVTDDEAEVYTDRDYRKVFTAQQKVYELLEPMFATVAQPFEGQKRMYTPLSAVQRIHSLWAKGLKPNEIAKMTGTSRATVYRNRPLMNQDEVA